MLTRPPHATAGLRHALTHQSPAACDESVTGFFAQTTRHTVYAIAAQRAVFDISKGRHHLMSGVVPCFQVPQCVRACA